MKWLKKTGQAAMLAISVLLIMALTTEAGPPFQTDDPEPVDFHHYEFYTFGNADGTGVEMDSAGPAVEFNWGILPNTQFHIGVKYRYVKETKHRPMIGTFTMIEVPTGNSNQGLGVGKVWAKLPVWLQKSFGPWTTYGGVGEQIVPQTGYKNFTYGGWLLQRDIGKKWTLGTEVFSHGAEGFGTPQIRASTHVDFGGYYYIRNPGFQVLFCYGHAVAGMPETYAYLGLYWTWGGSKDDPQSTKNLVGKLHRLEIPGLSPKLSND